MITKDHINKAIDYTTYRNLIQQLFNEGKSTGPVQNEKLLNFTGLNIHRMNRVEKTTVLNDELILQLKKIGKEQIWLVLTEGWCGDAAQQVPLFNCIEKLFSMVKLKLLLRDENVELMNGYLTNGNRSIPKLIILDAKSLTELVQWGPQPQEAVALINELKAAQKETPEIKEKLHLWYAKNNSKALQKELTQLLADIKVKQA